MRDAVARTALSSSMTTASPSPLQRFDASRSGSRGGCFASAGSESLKRLPRPGALSTARLASIRPGDPGFEEAARLRIEWRLAEGDPAAAAEAQRLAETLLLRSEQLQDQLLRARAAIAAGRNRDARASLLRASERVTASRGGESLAEQVLGVARLLPEADFQEIQAELARPERAGRARREPDHP
jgi:hypothetical protein